MTMIKSLCEKVVLIMRYYRVEGNWITTSFTLGLLVVLPLLLFGVFSFNSHLSLVAFFVGYLLAIITLIVFWASLVPKWFLRLTQDGFAEYMFGFNRLFSWPSIRRYEVVQPPSKIPGRYRYQLVLTLRTGKTRILLFKYGIDTESEISGFIKVLESYLTKV
jgi:hypothetical protein